MLVLARLFNTTALRLINSNISQIQPLDDFHFRRLKIKGFDAAFRISITLFTTFHNEISLRKNPWEKHLKKNVLFATKH